MSIVHFFSTKGACLTSAGEYNEGDKEPNESIHSHLYKHTYNINKGMLELVLKYNDIYAIDLYCILT